MLGLFLSYFIQTSVTLSSKGTFSRQWPPEEGSGNHSLEKEQYNFHCVIDREILA